jgi:DNA (cytosine-5)-methyltransferase 1
MAFEEEGFTVVRGPDVLWGGDIRRFHPPAGKFDGVIGGPPCQAFSRLAHMVRQRGYEPKFGNLIPEFERCIADAGPGWFVMEEVPDAPCPRVEGYAVHSFLLNNRWLGETPNRLRRISFGVRARHAVSLPIQVEALVPFQFEHAATGGSQFDGEGKRCKGSRLPWNAKSEKAFREVCRKQGLPDDFDLPAFTVEAKCKAVGNGVPLAMGRAIARAVMQATEPAAEVA